MTKVESRPALKTLGGAGDRTARLDARRRLDRPLKETPSEQAP